VTAGSETPRVAHEADECRRRQQTDSWDGTQPIHVGVARRESGQVALDLLPAK